MSEFERLYDAAQLPPGPQRLRANPAECAALAARFGLVAVHRLAATLSLSADGPAIRASGTLKAAITQSCAISGEDLAATIAAPLTLRFVPPADPKSLPEELELTADDCDEIELSGTQFDLGEAIAQSLALAIDPYATGPHAKAARTSPALKSAAAAGPFAALAALKGI